MSKVHEGECCPSCLSGDPDYLNKEMRRSVCCHYQLMHESKNAEELPPIETDGEITIKFSRKTYLGKPSHWELDASISGQVKGFIEGTSPNLYGLSDMFFEYLDEIDKKKWSEFDANKK